MGNIYGMNGNLTANIFARGGHAELGANDGVFTLRLFWGITSTNQALGFRCAR